MGKSEIVHMYNTGKLTNIGCYDEAHIEKNGKQKELTAIS